MGWVLDGLTMEYGISNSHTKKIFFNVGWSVIALTASYDIWAFINSLWRCR